MPKSPPSSCGACEYEISEALKRTLHAEYTRRLRLVLAAAHLRTAKGQEWDYVTDLVQNRSQDPVKDSPFWRLLDSGILALLSEIMPDSQVTPVVYVSLQAAAEDEPGNLWSRTQKLLGNLIFNAYRSSHLQGGKYDDASIEAIQSCTASFSRQSQIFRKTQCQCYAVIRWALADTLACLAIAADKIPSLSENVLGDMFHATARAWDVLILPPSTTPTDRRIISDCLETLGLLLTSLVWRQRETPMTREDLERITRHTSEQIVALYLKAIQDPEALPRDHERAFSIYNALYACGVLPDISRGLKDLGIYTPGVVWASDYSLQEPDSTGKDANIMSVVSAWCDCFSDSPAPSVVALTLDDGILPCLGKWSMLQMPNEDMASECTAVASLMWRTVLGVPALTDQFVSGVTKVLLYVKQNEDPTVEKTAYEFWYHFHERITHEHKSIVPACSSCSTERCKDNGPLQKCGRCEVLWYCSVSCQKRDWKRHKPYCVAVPR